MQKLKIFSTACLQVFLVCLSTFAIANQMYVSAVFISFWLSFTWTFNVKKIAFGTISDRITYAAGAAAGTTFGLIIANFIYV